MTSRSPGDPRRDLREAARAHAASLHRTAVMLTGGPDAALELVLATFDRLGRDSGGAGSGPHRITAGPETGETLLAELVREHLRHAPRGREDRVPPVGGLSDAGDVLHALGPRQRAAAVLVLVEGWSDDDAAQVLGVRPGRVPSLLPRPQGLAEALEAVADQDTTDAEDVVAAVLASLAVESADVGPTADREEVTGPRRWARSLAPKGQRRGVRLLAAAAVVVLATVAAMALMDEPDEAARRPVAGVDGAGSTSLSEGMSERGWVLDGDDDPPAQLEGLHLVETITIDYADATRPLALRTQPRAGYAVHAALWCDIPALDANLTVPTATLALLGATVELPCAGKGGEPGVRRLVPLPPPRGTLTAGATRLGRGGRGCPSQPPHCTRAWTSARPRASEGDGRLERARHRARRPTSSAAPPTRRSPRRRHQRRAPAMIGHEG